MTPRNPDPVVVGLILLEDEKLVLVRRNIEPFIGQLALPGGYVERGEDWRVALQREIEEEAEIDVSADPNHMKVYDVRSTPDGQKILIFAVINRDGVKKVRTFEKNNEVSERLVVPFHYYAGAPKLCFSLHSEVVEQYRNEHFDFAGAHPGGW